jgi:YVTN family beta-propeller protein
MKRAMLAFTLACLPFSPSPAQTLPLGAPDNWKYLAFDPASQEMFVAHGNEITVVDTATLRIIGHVPGLAGAHGVAIVPGGHGYAASGKNATVTVFDPKTFRPIAVLQAGADANSVTYDPASHHVFVANDDAGTITVIDAATGTLVASIALPGGEGLAAAASDGAGHLFVNHGAQGNLVRIDTRRSAVDATWPLPGCSDPEGLALDSALQRLFISCDNNRLVVLDDRNGKLVEAMPIGPASDTVLYDVRRARIYTANADGTLSVIKVAGADSYTVGAAIVTAKGARTAALDPATGIVYLVAANVKAAIPAAVARHHQIYSFEAGTVKLLAVDPAQPLKN